MINEKRYSTGVIEAALQWCGLKVDKRALQNAHAKGVFTAKRVKINNRAYLAATAQDVQTFLIVSHKGVAPLWMVKGLLEYAKYYIGSTSIWGESVQRKIDKEFGNDRKN